MLNVTNEVLDQQILLCRRALNMPSSSPVHNDNRLLNLLVMIVDAIKEDREKIKKLCIHKTTGIDFNIATQAKFYP